MATSLPYYRTSGSGDKTIFMLHGAGRYYDDLAGYLVAQGYRCVVWDCPGYGESPPVSPPIIERFAKAAVEMIRKEATGTNILFGHSMGAQIGEVFKKHVTQIPGKHF